MGAAVGEGKGTPPVVVVLATVALGVDVGVGAGVAGRGMSSSSPVAEMSLATGLAACTDGWELATLVPKSGELTVIG